MGCYYTLCHNTYAFSLLIYKVYMKRENAGSWNSGLEKEQILETYSAYLQKSCNSMGIIFRIHKKYWAKEVSEGGHPPSTRVGVRPTPWARPLPRGPPGSPRWPSSGIRCILPWKKNQKEAFGTKRHRLEEKPWRNQSRAPGELFCRGNIPPGGGNHLLGNVAEN